MKHQITSIPELLVAARGNMSEVARQFNMHRYTIKKYARDFDCKLHIVVNGVLMVSQGNRGLRRGENGEL